MAGRLSRLGVPYVLVERAQELTPAWRSHYDRLHLHTVKQYSHLPHKPFPPETPRYVPRQQLVQYYAAYAAEMGIEARLGCEIVSVTRAGQGWISHTQAGDAIRSEHVVICTGFNRKPHLPVWPGLDSFGGEVLHSSRYKNGAPYRGQPVLVVGMGNSGAEIALDLYEHGAQPALSVRGPVSIVKRDIAGRPTQVTAMMLSRLPHWLGDGIGWLTSKLTVGNLERYGLPQRNIAPARLLREFAQTPVMDIGTVAQIRQGHIRVFPAIERVGPGEVHFSDGRSAPFAALVLATGYHTAVEEFLREQAGVFNAQGHPRSWHIPTQPGLYFLGFDAYGSGILHSIYRDSDRIAAHMLGSG